MRRSTRNATRKTLRLSTLGLCTLLLWPAAAGARDVFVVTGELDDDGQSVQGQGVLRQRLGTCMVITPWHVVERYNDGLPVHVIGRDGRAYETRLKRHLEPDLAILEVVAGESLCEGPQLEAPEDLDAVLDGWSPMRLRLRQRSGDRQQLGVRVETFNDEKAEFTAEGNAVIEEGHSGGVVEAPQGALAMLLTTEGRIARALRWDALERAVASFFVEMDDIDLSCATTAPLIRVDQPTKTSDLLERWPAMDPNGGWSISNITARLRSAPRLIVSSRLDFDVLDALPACSISLAPAGQLAAPAKGQIRLVTLSFENQGGEIVSRGSPGATPAAPGGPGPPGAGHSTGGRKGCGGTRHGARGGPGQDGPPGGNGEPAGSLHLSAFQATGPFRVSLVGGGGGNGGAGGQGGRGGNGAGATSGSSSAFDCKCGGHPGGRGGDGGTGGRGGAGGAGGNSGDVTLITTSPVHPESSFHLQAGAPGTGGPGGPGGSPGSGGNRSGGTGFCSGQRGGSAGNRGPNGSQGPAGHAGERHEPAIRVLRTASDRPDLEAFFYAVLGETTPEASP